MRLFVGGGIIWCFGTIFYWRRNVLSKTRLHAVRAGNLKDVQKVNELLLESGYEIGECLAFGEMDHLFILFKPERPPPQDSSEDWKDGPRSDEEDEH